MYIACTFHAPPPRRRRLGPPRRRRGRRRAPAGRRVRLRTLPRAPAPRRARVPRPQPARRRPPSRRAAARRSPPPGRAPARPPARRVRPFLRPPRPPLPACGGRRFGLGGRVGPPWRGSRRLAACALARSARARPGSGRRRRGGPAGGARRGRGRVGARRRSPSARRDGSPLAAARARARRGETCKDALHAAVWGDIAVTEDSLVQCIGDIRRALGPDRDALRTLPKRGYRLDGRGSRRCRRLGDGGCPRSPRSLLAVLLAGSPRSRPPAAAATGPAVAVLPFEQPVGAGTLGPPRPRASPRR